MDVYDDADNQLKYIFNGVNLPVNDGTFFYDWTPHISDELVYQNNYPTPIDMATYFTVHKEIEYSLYNPGFLTPDSIVYDTATGFQSDTVSIGFIDYKFHKLVAGAINSPNYFMQHSNGESLESIPSQYNPGNPFTDENIFIMGVFRESANFLDVVFRLPKELFFIDQFNIQQYEGTVLKINFDNNNGWNLVDLNNDNFYQILY
jgi:hypothetical protein